MKRSKPWSLDQAIQDALAQYGVAKVDRHHSRRRETVHSMQPSSLMTAWADLLARLPEPWRERAGHILVVASPSDRALSPEAKSKGVTSRRIEVPRGFMWLMVALAEAHAAVLPLLLELLIERQESGPSKGDSFTELWRWVLACSQEFVTSHRAPPQLSEQIDWVAHVAQDSREAWEARQRNGHVDTTREVDVVVNCGLRFALAHELGHHLLNHLEPEPDVATLGVQAAVEGWAAQWSVELPDGLNPSQAHEWLADAFALMVLTTPLDRDQSRFFDLATLSFGASVAQLALFVAEEVAGNEASGKPSHPAVEDRLAPLIYTLSMMGRGVEQPEPVAGYEDHPLEAGFGALLVFGTTVIVLELLLQARREDP